MHESKTDKVASKFYKTVKLFISDQRDFEIASTIQRGQVWGPDNDRAMQAFETMCDNAVKLAKMLKKPQTLPQLKEIKRNPVTGEFDSLNIYFWPDGRVEFARRATPVVTRRERG